MGLSICLEEGHRLQILALAVEDMGVASLDLISEEVCLAEAAQFHYEFNPGGGGGGGFAGFNFSNPDDIFAEFLRGNTGMGGAEGFDDIFSSGGRSSGRSRSARYSGAEPASKRAVTPEVTTVVRPLPLSLEELYRGVHKKMKIKRKAFDEATGKRTTQDKVLEMDIKPGLKKGSKIKFKGVGDQEEGGQQDLHFIVEEVSSIEIKRKCPLLITHRKHIRCLHAKTMTSS